MRPGGAIMNERDYCDGILGSTSRVPARRRA
jgi:hypothetical protein